MKAIVMTGKPGGARLVTDRPHPKARPGYIIVEVKAVALNPTDWKHIDRMNTENCVVGCDYAGVVVETGTGYSKHWKVGDRVCGVAHGANELQPEDGGFAERIAVKADIQIRIADTMSFEQAATMGVGIMTCGQGLFQQMGLSWPSTGSNKQETILIHGGSSATGTLGIQLAKLAGYTVITTCSPHNFELVESLGAVAAFDYKDPDCGRKIKEYTNNKLGLVWDTVSIPTESKLCAEVISPNGSYGTILFGTFPRKDVKSTYSLGYAAIGEPVKKPGYYQEDCSVEFEWMKKWIPEAEGLLQKGILKPHPIKLGRGLENVLDGCDLMRHDKVSGQKLVYVL